MDHRNCSPVMQFYGETRSENIFRSHRKAVCNNFIVVLKASHPISEERMCDIYQSFYLSSAWNWLSIFQWHIIFRQKMLTFDLLLNSDLIVLISVM